MKNAQPPTLRGICPICNGRLLVASTASVIPRHQARGGDFCSGAGKRPDAYHKDGKPWKPRSLTSTDQPKPAKRRSNRPATSRPMAPTASVWPRGPIRSTEDLRRALRTSRPGRDSDIARASESLESLVRQVDIMTGPQFELVVAALLQRDGWAFVEAIGGRGDGGVDIIARSKRGGTLLVQCKRQSSSIPPAIVRQMVGSLHDYQQVQKRAGTPVCGQTRTAIVTTSNFSEEAERTAQRAGVELVAQRRLRRWIGGKVPIHPD